MYKRQISGSTVNVAFAADPNYESPADADTNNVYVVTVLIDDGTADDANGATTLTITVADLNDQTPVYQAADADDAITVNENVGTGSIDAGTITDTDTVGTYGCTLGGADAADLLVCFLACRCSFPLTAPTPVLCSYSSSLLLIQFTVTTPVPCLQLYLPLRLLHSAVSVEWLSLLRSLFLLLSHSR